MITLKQSINLGVNDHFKTSSLPCQEMLDIGVCMYVCIHQLYWYMLVVYAE